MNNKRHNQISLEQRLENAFEKLDSYGNRGTISYKLAVMQPMGNLFHRVLPYDFNTVHTAEGKYVNASWMKSLDDCSCYYIASQTPIEGIRARWWKAMLDASVKTVVMLCDLQERDVDTYFPLLKHERVVYRETSLYIIIENEDTTLLMESNIVVRQLKLIAMMGDREVCTRIKHLHVRNWPDGGTPANDCWTEGVPKEGMKVILQLLDLLPRSFSTINKLAVHCRAGIGRTGTLLAILFGRHILQPPLRLAMQLIKHLRRQRIHSISNSRQLLFVTWMFKYFLGYICLDPSMNKNTIRKQLILTKLTVHLVVSIDDTNCSKRQPNYADFYRDRLIICAPFKEATSTFLENVLTKLQDYDDACLSILQFK